VAKKIEPAHSCNPNFQNLSKVVFSILFLIKTTPFFIKTIPKPYYFLTLFIRIFFFLRFRAGGKKYCIKKSDQSCYSSVKS